MNPEIAYNLLTQAAIAFISLVFLFFTMLFWRLANIEEHHRTRHRVCSVMCCLVGLVRAAVLFVWFDRYEIRMIIPISAILSWAAIAVAGWMLVRHAEFVRRQLAKKPTLVTTSPTTINDGTVPVKD